MTDWKDIVKTVAPALATVLGGPLAGAAVGALSQAVLGKEGGTEEELATVISGASPDVLARIKEADAKLKSDLANANIRLEEIAGQDRASARQREVSLKDTTVPILAFIYTGLYFLMLYAIFRIELPHDEFTRGVLTTLIGVLTTAQAAILQYYFGSSKGSADKTALLTK